VIIGAIPVKIKKQAESPGKITVFFFLDLSPALPKSHKGTMWEGSLLREGFSDFPFLGYGSENSFKKRAEYRRSTV
jgi:hypothetical protein